MNWLRDRILKAIIYRQRNAFIFTQTDSQSILEFSVPLTCVFSDCRGATEAPQKKRQIYRGCANSTFLPWWDSANHGDTAPPLTESFLCYFRKLNAMPHLCLTLLSQLSETPTNSSMGHKVLSDHSIPMLSVRKHKKSTHLFLSSPLLQSHSPSTKKFKQKAEEHQKQLHLFDIDGSDVAYFCLKKKKKKAELYLKFNYKVSSEHTTVDFTRDYDLNLLLTWCLWTWMI